MAVAERSLPTPLSLILIMLIQESPETRAPRAMQTHQQEGLLCVEACAPGLNHRGPSIGFVSISRPGPAVVPSMLFCFYIIYAHYLERTQCTASVSGKGSLTCCAPGDLRDQEPARVSTQPPVDAPCSGARSGRCPERRQQSITAELRGQEASEKKENLEKPARLGASLEQQSGLASEKFIFPSLSHIFCSSAVGLGFSHISFHT